MLYTAGEEAQRRYNREPGTVYTLEGAIEKLKSCFEPIRTIISLRHEFKQRIQKEEEQIEKFANALLDMPTDCQFGELENDLLRDQFIFGLTSRKAKKKLLLQESVDFEKAVYPATLQ